MATRFRIGFLAGLVAAAVVGSAVVGTGMAELVSAARAVAPYADRVHASPVRPSLVETMVVVGQRPGRPASPQFPRDLVVSLSLGADGSVSQVRAVSDAQDEAALDALDTWLASQRFAPASDGPARRW